MIDGVLLLTELGLMLVLVVTVWRARQKGREDHLGLFAYKATLEPPQPPGAPRGAPGTQRRGGPPHA